MGTHGTEVADSGVYKRGYCEVIMIEPGNTASVTYKTDVSATSEVLGSGDLPVLGTPKVVALIEQAAVAALDGRLPGSSTSVGTQISVDHLAPTPVGGTVVATATVVVVDGRQVTFEATVTESHKAVALGMHTRFIVDRARFMASMLR
jgi:predicted thioesterase